MKTLQTVTAVIELGAGFALMCCPSPTAALLVGAAGGACRLKRARVGGAALLTLGVACSLGRGDTQSRAARGLVAAMLFYNLAVASVLAYAGLGYRLHGVALWPAVVLHAGMAVWCIASLGRGMKQPAPAAEPRRATPYGADA